MDWSGAPITTSLPAKRRDRFPVELRFMQNGSVVSKPTGAVGVLALKDSIAYGTAFVASAEWSAAGYGSNSTYIFDLNLNTEPLEELFDGEPNSKDLSAEVSVSQGSYVISSQTFGITVSNDVVRGDEESPVGVPDGKATQAEAEAGTSNEKWMTPLRTAQAIAELGGAGSEGFVLDPNAKITGSEGNAETEFGGWGVGMQLADDNAITATMQPDGFRASNEVYSTHLGSNALTLDNGAKLRKGTTDAGNGGYRGIALECSAQYELKWEAGRLYVLEQDGFTIRRVEHCGTQVPDYTQDGLKGFTTSSRWILDDGTTYVCTDAAADDAQWEQSIPTSLSASGQITITGSATLANSINLRNTEDTGVIEANFIKAQEFDVDSGGQLSFLSGSGTGLVASTTTAFRTITLPNATGTLAVIPETRMVYWVGDGSADVVNATTGYLKTSRGSQPPLPIAASRDLYLTVHNVTGATRAIMLPRQQTQIDGNGDTRDILNLGTSFTTGAAPYAHSDGAKNGDRLILDYRTTVAQSGATTASTLYVKAYPLYMINWANVNGVLIPYVGFYTTNLSNGLPIENYTDCNLITLTAAGLYAFELVDGAWVYRGAVSGTHTHGNLTNDGKIGTSADRYVTTTTGGAIIAGGSFYNKYTQTVTASGASVTNPSAYGKRSEQIFIFNANCLMQFQLSAGVLGDVIAVTAQAGTSALGSVQVTNSTIAEIATLQVGHSREFIYNGTAWELVPLRSSGSVTQIVAGSNVSISPTSGTGAVTINTTNSPFVLTAASASGTLTGTSGQIVGPWIGYFNGAGGSGYSSNISNRQRTMHQACVIKKACVTLASSNASVVSDGVVSFYNTTTSTDYPLFSGVSADTTSNFVVYDATNLTIPVSSSDKFTFKISWPTTNPANVRVMVDLYCYPV